MVMITTFTKFRQNAKDYFDAVQKKGAVVRVMRHGKIFAEVSPFKEPNERGKKVSPALTIPGISLSKAILREREHQR